MIYRLECIYPYSGSLSLDHEIERVVGRKFTDSGCGFGERDICFTFKQELAAHRAAKKVKTFFGKKIKVKVKS